jgi:hypothetical protein
MGHGLSDLRGDEAGIEALGEVNLCTRSPQFIQTIQDPLVGGQVRV